MKHNQITKVRAFGVLAALAFGAALSGGACSSTVPSDQTSSSTSGSGSGGGKGASTTAASTTASSGGTGGASTTASTGSGTGTGAMGTGGAPSDCSTNPMTYLEIINACTTAQQVDLMPVLPLLEADGGLPALP
jgi:hypothetical protein